MALSLKQKDEVDAEMLRNGGKIGKAAADLELPYDDVLDYASEGLRVTTTAAYSTPRPELRKYIVVSKGVDAAWPHSPALEQAQSEYDKGYVELCQWREGNIIHLLSIRRQVRVKNRRGYFSRSFEEPCSRGTQR